MGLLIVWLGFVLCGCVRTDPGRTLWIYTSVYKDVVNELNPILLEKFPGVKFEWYQAGSETVAARVNAELMTGRSKADLILTSDPFWYLELAQRGHLKKTGATTVRVLKEFKNESGVFEVVRLPVAVIGYNAEVFKTEKPPTSWQDLRNKKYKDRISMGSPIESGTAFSMVAQLFHAHGWEYFQALRTNGLLSAGGNSAVINRMETKERPVGITLLENILEARKRGSPIEFVYPADGAVWVPSPIAIMAKTKEPELAQAVYDFFFSKQMQIGFVHGRMYSPVFAELTPQEGKPYSWVMARSLPWSNKVLSEIFDQRASIKRTFAETVMK